MHSEPFLWPGKQTLSLYYIHRETRARLALDALKKWRNIKNKVFIFVFSLCCPLAWIKESCRADKVAWGWQLLWQAEAHVFSSRYALPVWYRLKVCLHLTCTHTVISVKWWVKSVRVTTGNHPHLCFFIFYTLHSFGPDVRPMHVSTVRWQACQHSSPRRTVASQTCCR